MKRWIWLMAAVGVLAVAWWRPGTSDARALSNAFTQLEAADGGSQFATGQVNVSTTTGKLVRDTSTTRRRLIVFNPGPNDVAVGTGTAISFGNGYIIPSGAERTFYHSAAVYAISSSTNTTMITWEEDQE